MRVRDLFPMRPTLRQRCSEIPLFPLAPTLAPRRVDLLEVGAGNPVHVRAWRERVGLLPAGERAPGAARQDRAFGDANEARRLAGGDLAIPYLTVWGPSGFCPSLESL
jgi:hypothetical protein